MKIILLFLVTAFLTPFITYAQDFAGYGSVTPEELALTECAFDKDANAIVLLDESVSDHDEDYHLINYRHVRIKILKEKGFDEANITLHFWRKDDFEFIDNLEAMVTNTNAAGEIVTEKLTKKSFYTKNINEHTGAVTFTFPNIKVGSIIEYK